MDLLFLKKSVLKGKIIILGRSVKSEVKKSKEKKSQVLPNFILRKKKTQKRVNIPFKCNTININVLGLAGVGKSTLCNLLAECNDAFKVGDGIFLSTTKIEYKDINHCSGRRMRIHDTPEFCSKSAENILNSILDPDVIYENKAVLHIICLNGSNPRFTYPLQNFLRFVRKHKSDFFENSVLVFNKCTHLTDKTRLTSEYQKLFEQLFQRQNIPCFFIDSFYYANLQSTNTDDLEKLQNYVISYN